MSEQLTAESIALISLFVGAPALLILRNVFIWNIVPKIKEFNPELGFKLSLYYAKKGYYSYDGSMMFAAIRGVPTARVQYEDGVSMEMAFNTAVNYASMFNGKVIPA